MKANKDLKTFENFMSIPSGFFKTLGIQPYRTNDDKDLSILSTLLFYLGFFNLNCAVVGEVIYLMKSFGTFSNFLEATALAPCIGFCLISDLKMLTVWWGKITLTDIMQTLKDHFPTTVSQHHDYKTTRYEKELRILMISVSVLLMILIWMFNLFAVGQSTIEYLFLRKDFEYRFAYFIWYPFDSKTVVSYPLVYIHQMYAGYVAAAGALAPDLLLCCAVIQLCMQFDYISRKIREIHANGSLDDQKRIGALIHHHGLILKLSADLNDVFSASILFNFLTSSVIICLVGFQVTAGVATVDLIKYLLFLIYSLIQIMVMCYYGQKLIDASEGVGDSSYNHDWFDGDNGYKKSIIITIMRAQKPAELNAVSFAVVSLQSFSKVLSLAYQFFALLRTMYQQ